MTSAASRDVPIVLVITGLPGTGKSTVADHIAELISVPSFSGDWLLGAIAPSGVLDDVERSVTLGIYERLLQTLFTRQLMLGQSAVLDCVVSDELIARWSMVATDLGGRLITVECICSDQVVHRSRIEGRVRGIPGWHEIGWSHVESMRREVPPLTSERMVIDAIEPPDQNVTRVLAHIDSVLKSVR